MSNTHRMGGTVKRIGIMEARTGDQTERSMVGVLAGAIAEGIAEKYKDGTEPSACARAAEEAHRELMAELKLLPGQEARRENPFEHGRFRID